MLNDALRKHMKNYESEKDFVNTVLQSFYVDDFSGGKNSVEEAFELFKRLKIRFLERFFTLENGEQIILN